MNIQEKGLPTKKIIVNGVIKGHELDLSDYQLVKEENKPAFYRRKNLIKK